MLRVTAGPAIAVMGLVYGGASLCGSDLVADLQPAAITSAYGPVKKFVLNTPGLAFVDSHALAFHSPGSMVHFHFAEPVWIIAYETEIHDSAGRPPLENYLCHTFLGNEHVEQLISADGKAVAPEMKGLFSDAFTRSVHLPEGFGIHLLPGEEIEWMPMFNNRTDDDTRVAMSASIYVIRDADRKKPIRPVYSVLQSVSTPHLFYVQPGSHQQQAIFQLPFNGEIHFVGAHIHPYAKSIELFNITRAESVWNGAVKEDAKGRTESLRVYSSSAGYSVRAGEKFRLTSRYENPNNYPIDAMAGAFIVYTKN